MIQVGKTAKRYAEALFQVSEELPRAKVENTLADLTKVWEIVKAADAEYKAPAGQSGLLELLRGQEIDAAQKVGILEGLLGAEAAKLQKTVINFVSVILEAGRFDLYEEILAAFQLAVWKKENKVVATVHAPFALTESQQAHLTQQIGALAGRAVELEVTLDPSLIGGVKVEIEGTLYDFSLQGQLERLSLELTK